MCIGCVSDILEKPKEKFQIGDLVYVKPTAIVTDHSLLGKGGVIRRFMEGSGLIGVEFFQNVHGGVTLNGALSQQRGHWFQKNELEIIKEHHSNAVLEIVLREAINNFFAGYSKRFGELGE